MCQKEQQGKRGKKGQGGVLFFNLAGVWHFYYYPSPLLRAFLDIVDTSMAKSALTVALVFVGVVFIAGCASAPRPPAGSSAQAAATQGVEPAAPAPPIPESTAQAGSQPASMQEVMAELQQLGDLDPAAQGKLLADLRETDPALWPLVLQQFRAAMAYRRRAERRAPSIAGPVEAAPGEPYARQDASPIPAEVPPAAAGRQPGGEVASNVDRLPPTGDAAVPPKAAPEDNYPSTTTPVSYDTAAPADWHEQVDSAARALASQVDGSPKSPEEIARHAQLRMLYLLANRREDALQPIPAITPAVQEFWKKQLYGLSTWLDTQTTPDATRRAAVAKRILGEAVTQLGESAPLEVHNLAFCTAIDGYGCIMPFAKDAFAPGQEVLLYAEVENFSSEETAKGHHTSLRSSYEIFDTRGGRVTQRDCPKTEEYCRNARRDFFIGYRLKLPDKHIYPGKHTLRLTIEDLKSHKVGQASIELSIKSP